jgi:hypothetical protein
MSKGRETIDRMRDLCVLMFGDNAAANAAFGFHCMATAVKYLDRVGLKGDASVDQAKADWYMQMALHVLGRGPDPRAQREQFTPWSAEPVPRELLLQLCGLRPEAS